MARQPRNCRLAKLNACASQIISRQLASSVREHPRRRWRSRWPACDNRRAPPSLGCIRDSSHAMQAGCGSGGGDDEHLQAVLHGLVDKRKFDDVVELIPDGSLGDGRFGRVVSAVWRPTGERVAVKIPISADFARMGEPAPFGPHCMSCSESQATAKPAVDEPTVFCFAARRVG